MPASPKIGDRQSNIRMIEIFGKVETEHFAETDSHIGITGEIVVDLECVSQCTEPSEEDGHFRDGHRKCFIGNDGEGIGKQHFFCEAANETATAGGEIAKIFPPVHNLVGNGFVADDGTGNELRKESNVQAGVQDVSLDFGIFPINVQNIRNGLKGKKRNTDGQNNGRYEKMCTEKIIDVDECEYKIFKYEQDAEIEEEHCC